MVRGEDGGDGNARGGEGGGGEGEGGGGEGEGGGGEGGGGSEGGRPGATMLSTASQSLLPNVRTRSSWEE